MLRVDFECPVFPTQRGDLQSFYHNSTSLTCRLKLSSKEDQLKHTWVDKQKHTQAWT